MRICLFEDRAVANLEPLALSRPAFDLLCGQDTLGSKQCHFFAPCETGLLVRPNLANLCRLYRPGMPVNDLAWLRAEPTVLVNGRWLPPPDGVEDMPTPGVALVGGEIAYAVVTPDQLTYCSPNTLDDCLETWKRTLVTRPAGGRLVRYLWELVEWNGEQLCADYQRLSNAQIVRPYPSSVTVVGPAERLCIDPTAQVEPLVLVDTTRGPVVIDREAMVAAFSRLEGPCYVGPGTQILGAKVRAGTTLGPNCRIGGEVEASIVQGHSNKYHDGFLGHSYIGEWVNLGAGTSNSDLRNDYGPVRVTLAGRLVQTGRSKVGCFLGDHTKTGLGTLLNTGTNAGVFCNLLPGGLLPRHIPSFSTCWSSALAANAELPALFETAHTVMARRGAELTSVHEALFRGLFEQTAALRRRMLLEAEQQHRRRSA